MKPYSLVLGMLRSIRIVFSATCVGLCLSVVVFWVRSYTYMDGGMLKILPSEYVQIHAGDGRMCIWFEHKYTNEFFDWWSSPITVHTPPDAENRIPIFGLAFWPTFARLYLAHWVLAVAIGFLAVIPWCPRNFNIRSLLIAATVVASFAAVIAWVDRTF